MELSDFYKDVSTDRQLADEPPPELRIDNYRADLKSQKNQAEGIMYLGEKQQELKTELGVVEKMLKDVAGGVTDALNNLIQKFSSNNFGICSFKMPSERVGRDGALLDEYGNPIENYGIKEITSEAQRKRLQKDFEIAMMYLPHIRMQEMKSADKKDLILVTGINSSEFNAVVKAHREKERLTKEIALLGKEKDGVMQNMGLSTSLQVTSDGNRTVDTTVNTPAVAQRDVSRSH